MSQRQVSVRLREFVSRMRFLLARRVRKDQSDLNEELQFHIAQSVARNLAAGQTPKEAARQARLEFGGFESARELTFSQRPGWYLETFSQDARYAFRSFLRTPVFAITVIATLALGIGATTAVFSVVDRILFRALPYEHAEDLVSIGLTQSLEKQEFTVAAFFFDWKENQKPFADFASQGASPHACTLGETSPLPGNCVDAQATFLPMLGVHLAVGRNFLPEEDLPNGPRVAIISYGLWQRSYGSDLGVINRQLDVDGAPARIIGVLPRDFELPTMQAADVIFPLGVTRPENGGLGRPMRTFARLKPGVTLAQARAEMEPLFFQTRDKLIPQEMRKDFHLGMRSLRDRQTEDVQRTSWVLLASVLALLLIACANIAGLLLTRASSREREMAVRSAIGASRTRLVSQALTESLMLSLFSAALGLLLAGLLLRFFVAMAPTSVPYLDRAGIDLRVAIFSVMASLVCGAVLGLIPALQRSRPGALGARSAGAARHAALRRALVTVQIAVSIVLLAAGSLLIQSFNRIEHQQLGMATEGATTVAMTVPGFRGDAVGGMVSRHNDHETMDFYLRAEQALRRLPGVRAVGYSDSFPPGGGWQDSRRLSDMHMNGQAIEPPATGGTVRWRSVTPEYFRALEISLRRGRGFTEQDRSGTERLMIVNALAAKYLSGAQGGGAEIIGKQIEPGSDGTKYTIVGIAEDVRNGGLSEPQLPEMDILRRNVPEDWGTPVPVMLIASAQSTQAMAPWIRSEITRLNPRVPVTIESLSLRVQKLADRPRFEASLLGFFAANGLWMAVLGLYGVMAYLALQRTQEIGVRMALGANRHDILWMVAAEGLRLIALGTAIGLISALCVTRMLSSLLYEVGPRDPAAIAGSAILLALAAMAATLVPAMRAMRVDPVEALRSE